MAKTIADTLRRAIRKSGKTALEIAIGAGVPQASLSDFLRGKDLRLQTAQKLCDYFGLELKPKRPRRRH